MRLNYLDYARGIGIIFVILGHIYSNNNNLVVWLYSFHIPLFFIITGILVKYKIKKYISLYVILKKRIKELIVPYFVFEFLSISVDLFKDGFSISSLLNGIINTLTVNCNDGPLWFLPTLFIAELTFILILNLIVSKKITALFLIIIYIIPFFIETKIHLIIVLLRCFTAIGFIGFGYFIEDYIIKKDIKLLYIIIIFIFDLSFALYNGRVDLWNMSFRNPFIYTACALIGSLVIICTIKKMKNAKLLSYLGKNSLIIMATHNFLIGICIVVLGGRFTLIEGLLYGVLVLLSEIPIIEVINRCFPWIIGKSFKKYSCVN